MPVVAEGDTGWSLHRSLVDYQNAFKFLFCQRGWLEGARPPQLRNSSLQKHTCARSWLGAGTILRCWLGCLSRPQRITEVLHVDMHLDQHSDACAGHKYWKCRFRFLGFSFIVGWQWLCHFPNQQSLSTKTWSQLELRFCSKFGILCLPMTQFLGIYSWSRCSVAASNNYSLMACTSSGFARS